MRRAVCVLFALAATAAAPSAARGPAASTPTPGLWGRYLLAYSSCTAPAVACQEQLAQSRDGVRWAPVVGFTPRPSLATDCCEAVRRGSRLYLFDGLSVRRFAVSARSVTEVGQATVSLDSAGEPEWSDVLLDPPSRLVLVYAVPGISGGPLVRTASEQPGSDGTVFVTDRGDRAALGPSSGPVSVLRSRSGWLGLVTDAACLRLLAAGDLRGLYRDGGCLTTPATVTSPSGYWNPALHEFWLYGSTSHGLVRAVGKKLTAPLAAARFRPLRGLRQGPTIGSVRFSSA